MVYVFIIALAIITFVARLLPIFRPGRVEVRKLNIASDCPSLLVLATHKQESVSIIPTQH